MGNFLRGIVAGIAIGYLYAPRSGRKSRAQLSESLNRWRDKWDGAKSQINELVGDVKAQMGTTDEGDLADAAENKLDEFKYEADRTKENAKRDYNATVEDLSDEVKSGIDSAERNLKL